METYHKINAPYKRHRTGPDKGKFIKGEWSLPELEYLADNKWEFTEKVDGTNIRVNIKRMEDTLFAEYGGRTDNAVIPKPLVHKLRELFPKVSSSGNRDSSGRDATIGLWMIENNIDEVTFFGEGYGPKIQNGGNYRNDVSFVLFDVKIGPWWMQRSAVEDIAKTLDLEVVPLLGYGTLYDAMGIVSNNMRSQWGDFEAEGIIAKPKVPLFARDGSRVITKIKGVDFR